MDMERLSQSKKELPYFRYYRKLHNTHDSCISYDRERGHYETTVL